MTAAPHKSRVLKEPTTKKEEAPQTPAAEAHPRPWEICLLVAFLYCDQRAREMQQVARQGRPLAPARLLPGFPPKLSAARRTPQVPQLPSAAATEAWRAGLAGAARPSGVTDIPAEEEARPRPRDQRRKTESAPSTACEITHHRAFKQKPAGPSVDPDTAARRAAAEWEPAHHR